jgi:large subunit ribosomal protein L10
MSKYVKDLLTDNLRSRLTGVGDAILVNIVGMDANRNSRLRQELRKKNISITLVKNSLARRATEGTPLSAAFQGVEGALAVVWGGEDIVSLAKEITRLAESKEFEGLQPKGGAMDGAKLSAKEVKDVSLWPSREEQLSLLIGQILSPGAKLSSQLIGTGGALASQIKQKGEEEEGAAAEAAPAAE